MLRKVVLAVNKYGQEFEETKSSRERDASNFGLSN